MNKSKKTKTSLVTENDVFLVTYKLKFKGSIQLIGDQSGVGEGVTVGKRGSKPYPLPLHMHSPVIESSIVQGCTLTLKQPAQ